jgi:hypothetical protein
MYKKIIKKTIDPKSMIGNEKLKVMNINAGAIFPKLTT